MSNIFNDFEFLPFELDVDIWEAEEAPSGALGLQVLVGGAWKTASSAQILVAGVWKTVQSAQVLVSGSWRAI